MNPLWRTRLAATAAALLAVAVGWWIAHGSLGLPLLLTVMAAAACLFAVFGLPLDAVALGGLLVGYILGNRGFAQFSLVPGLPLLPAEAGLAVCLAWLVVTSAFHKELPFRRDALNAAVLLWIAIGGLRIVPDLRTHGAMALRDFAMVYYALFFFVAQALMTRAENVRAFLERCVLVSVVAVIPLFELFRRFPEFFLGKLVIGGIPLIYFKGDLVATFMAVGVLLSHRRWERTRRPMWLLAALLGFVGIALSGNRASLLGLLVATGWLVLARQWALLRTQIAVVVVACLVLLGGVAAGVIRTKDTFLYQLYERVASITDFTGDRAYASSEGQFKADNNQYRLVWWRSVIDETIAGGPTLGLGFGHDLAAGFVRRYYPDYDEEFTTRSPHSIFITVFGRMGTLGLLPFLAIVAAIARSTWRAARSTESDDERFGWWLAAWVVLMSASFGVVLEGPMGAVVFWTLVGMANAPKPETAIEALPDERASAEPILATRV